MFKISALFALVALLHQVSAGAKLPFFPDVYDTNATYVQGRCIDYCAFLRPDQICPRNPLDVACLCYVYNIRLPACESCWAGKNATVANDLSAIISFCGSYVQSVSASASASFATATEDAVLSTPATSGSSQSASASSSSTAVVKSSDASGMVLLTRGCLVAVGVAAMIFACL